MQNTNLELCHCGSGKPQNMCCDNKIAEIMSGFQPGLRFKGGIKYDNKKKGFVVIVHSWNNVNCIGNPTEYALPQVFQEEEVAMDYYKNNVRPFLSDMLDQIQKQDKNIKVKKTKLE